MNYNAPPEYFEIQFTKQVVFRDMSANVLKIYEVGNIIKASADIYGYYVTPMGGIFHDEAVRL